MVMLVFTAIGLVAYLVFIALMVIRTQAIKVEDDNE